LDNNWLWNAWAGSGQNVVADMAAHLHSPILGRDWLVRTDADPLRLLLVCDCPDTAFGFTNGWILADATAPGFPYGFTVDQTRLVLT